MGAIQHDGVDTAEWIAMAEDAGMLELWPAKDAPPVDDEALIERYRPEPDRPSLRLNFVTSVDGAVEVEGYSAGLGSPADQRVFHLLRMFADALMVGAGTLRHEGYGGIRLDERRRAWRREHGLAPYPRLIVVSRRLDLDPTHPALCDAPVRAAIVTCAGSPPDLRTALAASADVLVHGEDEVDLPAAMADLRARGYGHVLSEGGPHLLGALTAADLVDELCLTIAPMLAGPGAGRITAGPPSPVRGLRLAHLLSEDDVLLLRYVRNGPS
jgi:riboflavin biosynthesis pyrimidine reductase